MPQTDEHGVGALSLKRQARSTAPFQSYRDVFPHSRVYVSSVDHAEYLQASFWKLKGLQTVPLIDRLLRTDPLCLYVRLNILQRPIH